MSNKKGTVQLILEVNGKPASLEYQKLSKQLDGLIKEQSELNETGKKYGENAKEIQKIKGEMTKILPTISNLTKEKRKLTKELKNMTVGSKEFIETSERLSKVNVKLKSITNQTKGYSKEIKKASSFTGKMKSGLSSMAKVNPFSLMLGPIGLIISAIGLLIGVFSKSERGAKIMAQATGVINAVLGTAVKLVNDFIGVLQNIFTKSETPIKDLGKLIVDNIKMRIEAVIESASRLGKALLKLFKGDFKGAGDEVKKAGSAFVSVITGMDDKKIKEVTKDIQKNTKAHVNLALAKRRGVGAAVELTKAVELLTTKEAILMQTADDATLSFEVRTKAAKEAMKASEERANKEIELAKAQAAILNEEIRLKKANGEDVNSLLEAQGGAIAAVMAAERELLTVQAENATRIRQLKQDELEKNLDILIDGFDKQKTVNERIIANDKTTHDQKVKLLEETKRLADGSFIEQMKTIEAFTGGAVNANDLINESNAVVLNEKIRALGLSEIIEGRLLEIINERKIANLDLSDVEQDINQSRIENLEENAEKRKALSQKELSDELELLEVKRQEREILEGELFLIALEKAANDKELKLQAESDYQQSLIDLESEFLLKKSSVLKQAGESDLEIKKELADKELELAKQKSDKQIELEERTKAARESIQKSSRDFALDSFDFIIDLLSKDEEARKKNAAIIKGFEIAKVVTNSIAEISAIWKNSNSNPSNILIPGFGTALAVAQTALSVGRTALAIRSIRAQSFASGGYTGRGFALDPSTGERWAGGVHAGEWVAPRWQVNDPNFAPIIESLEAARTGRGYAVGGYVDTTPRRDAVQLPLGENRIDNNLVAEKMDILIDIFSTFPKEIRGYFTYEQLTDILSEGENNDNLGGL